MTRPNAYSYKIHDDIHMHFHNAWIQNPEIQNLPPLCLINTLAVLDKTVWLSAYQVPGEVSWGFVKQELFPFSQPK